MGKTESLVALWKRLNSALPSKYKLVIWAAIISLVLTLAGQAAPINYVLTNFGTALRSKEASKDIVVVAVDDKTIDKLGTFPIKRRYYGDMVNTLFAKGARHVFINLAFATKSDPADDAELAEVLRRYPKKVSLGSTRRSMNGRQIRHSPLAIFLNDTDIFDPMTKRSLEYGVTTHLPLLTSANNDVVPSLSAKLARTNVISANNYRVDFAMRPDSVPTISAVDVVEGRVTEPVMGKDVVISPTATGLGEQEFYISSYKKFAPMIYFHIAGAETLKRGMSVELSWAWLWGAAILCSLLLAQVQSSFRILSGTLAICLVMFSGSLILNNELIFIDLGPAMIMLVILAVMLVRMRYKAYMQKKSFSNHVSGLPNLAALQQEIEQQHGNVVVAKVHNFAEIHSVLNSDDERELVEQIARRLSYVTGNSSLHQGDEGIFAWICDDEKASISTDELDALFILFRNPVRIKDRAIDLNLSFGVDADEARLVSNRLGSALTAAEDAKKAGERWKFVNLVDRNSREWRISLLGELDSAIDKGEVWVAYQPKFDLRTNRICGAEALARWRHPERGDISPGEFIPLAEEQNRIEKLTHFVLNDAVQHLAAVSAIAPDFSISVNISPRLLIDPSLSMQVLRILQSHDVEAGRLTLEITETAMLSDNGNNVVENGLRALRNAGVHISIDDYGTGYSTLEYFRAIPATEIKIDRCFIGLIEQSHSDRIMVRSTIQLAHAMERNVVAEGVETAEQMDLLKEMGCDQVQGYFTGKPQHFSALSENFLPKQHRKVG